MKATIVFEDDPAGTVNVRVEFEPAIHADAVPTPAQHLAMKALEAMHSQGSVVDADFIDSEFDDE